jgi:hypothetical protein
MGAISTRQLASFNSFKEDGGNGGGGRGGGQYTNLLSHNLPLWLLGGALVRIIRLLIN